MLRMCKTEVLTRRIVSGCFTLFPLIPMVASEQSLLIDADSFSLLRENEIIKRLNVSRTTLWRMRAEGLPAVNVGRSVRYDMDQVLKWLSRQDPVQSAPSERASSTVQKLSKVDINPTGELLACHWSPSVALDPRHRPQSPSKPSSTVRREWWRFPQEAHLLDTEAGRYRRLSASEICVLQGFPPDWGGKSELGELELIRGYGDAVPPPLSQAIFATMQRYLNVRTPRALEICAGFGGLALGATRGMDLEHVALVERWAPACAVLRSSGMWGSDKILQDNVRQIDWDKFCGSVDVLSGGPPCQPWSQAGQGMGSDDERDLLGLTPEIVGRVKPQAFVFENVPGLLSGENQSYASDLVRRLREVDKGYAVALGVLNAADFGVPQVRRRVFIVGFRGTSVSEVHRFFDDVYAIRTCSNPRLVIPRGLRPWVTISEVLPNCRSNNHMWRRWLNPPTIEQMPETAPSPDREAHSLDQKTRPKRIQLQWPTRENDLAWTERGWEVVANPRTRNLQEEVVPLVAESSEGCPRRDPWYISSDPLTALQALKRTHGRLVDLVYIDTPRLVTNAAKFDAAAADAALNTWLSLTLSMLRSGSRLLSDRGVIAVLAGIDETPYVEILLRELLGPKNHIGTVVWQKGYSPRNMPNMRDLSPTHDNIVLFARRKEILRPVCLQVPAEGFKNLDSDPRGDWNAEQKGANKPDCDYEVNICPYRWRISKGSLPPGVWRINPKTGVIWAREGDLEELGVWRFTLEVADSKGATAEKDFEIRVVEDAVEPPLAILSWLPSPFTKETDLKAGEALKITTSKLPFAKRGAQYSAAVYAQGGKPWLGTTRPGKTSKAGKARYWEFPIQTLLARAAVDAVDFKQKDDAIPALKSYRGDSLTTYRNQTTVWLGRTKAASDSSGGAADISAVGYSQDATQELVDLAAKNIVKGGIGTSKPMRLMARLLALFTNEHSSVVDIGSPAAEMASVATAFGRKTVYVEFPNTPKQLRDDLLLPRLLAASAGVHPLPAGVVFSRDTAQGQGEAMKGGAFVVDGSARQPASGKAGVVLFKAGVPFVHVDHQASICRINYNAYQSGSEEFLSALANVEGLVRTTAHVGCFAESLDGRTRAIQIDSGAFLDSKAIDATAESHSEFLSEGGRIRIYYHRGLDGLQVKSDHRVEVRRLPFALTSTAGVL